MLKGADHLEKVKRLRIADAELDPLKPAYEVSVDNDWSPSNHASFTEALVQRLR